MNKFAEHIKGQISKSAATVKELEELAKKYEEDLRGLGYTDMQVDPYFAYGQYGFYFNFMREDGKPGQKFTGLDTKNNTKLNLRNAYYDLINRKNWYLKRQAKQTTKGAKVTKKASNEDEKAALAKYLNINENDITKNEDSFHFGIPEFTTKNGEQYSVSANESAIKDAVAENMENLFDELGFEEFKEKVLPYVGGFENTFSVSESHFYDEVYRELEEDGIEEPTDEQIEKRQQEIIDTYGSAEEFFIEFGDEYVKQMIDHGVAYMNFETMAENVISEYGAGHELSSYDNSTEEVEYNGKTYYIFRQAKKTNKMNKQANKEEILSIDINDQDFLQGLARKYPLATVREIQRAIFNLKKTNITETIMSEVADYFKDKGFDVKEKGIGFEIKANKNAKKATNKLANIINREINKFGE